MKTTILVPGRKQLRPREILEGGMNINDLCLPELSLELSS